MQTARRMVITVVAVAMAMVAVPLHTSAAGQVPLRATLTEIDRGEAFCPATQMQFLCVTVTGTGEATHLGAITESAVIVVDLSTVNPATGCADEIRTSTFTAANGDQITLQGPGQVCGDQTHAAGGDNWGVLSGTGRFADAVGSGSDSVSIDRLSSPVTSVTTFSGVLS